MSSPVKFKLSYLYYRCRTWVGFKHYYASCSCVDLVIEHWMWGIIFPLTLLRGIMSSYTGFHYTLNFRDVRSPAMICFTSIFNPLAIWVQCVLGWQWVSLLSGWDKGHVKRGREKCRCFPTPHTPLGNSTAYRSHSRCPYSVKPCLLSLNWFSYV